MTTATPTKGSLFHHPLPSTELLINVSHILFDFSLDDDDQKRPTKKERVAITNTTINTLWSVDNTDGLIEDDDELNHAVCDVISEETGWLIEDIDYEVQ